MTSFSDPFLSPILLLVAGAKGAVASTLAVAVAALNRDPNLVLPSLTTAEKFPYLGSPQAIQVAGWDKSRTTLIDSIKDHGVLTEEIWRPYAPILNRIPIIEIPEAPLNLKSWVAQRVKEIRQLKTRFPNSRPVFINLLPASASPDLSHCRTLSQLFSELDPQTFPDMAYVLAAIQSRLPIINFTSNEVELPLLLREAIKKRVPWCGRDGKTGQTYLKVVLASAFKARNLFIDGWYSLNILGNADGANLADPDKARGKLKNKTELLDEILGYKVGKRYSAVSHKVSIDYYPPRGDAKEAWDVIDFLGLFGLPMSLRLDLQGRDSILAAPLILDLARWMTAVHLSGKSGPISELGFFFKKPVGKDPPVTFQDQIFSLDELERACDTSLSRKPVTS